MDWHHVLFAAEQGIVGLTGLAVTAQVFVLAATANRKFQASASSLTAFSVFATSCLLAGVPGIEASQYVGYFPLAGLAATVILVVPSALALRWRWLGLLHLLTVAAAVYLWLIGSLAISHDAT